MYLLLESCRCDSSETELDLELDLLEGRISSAVTDTETLPALDFLLLLVMRVLFEPGFSDALDFLLEGEGDSFELEAGLFVDSVAAFDFLDLNMERTTLSSMSVLGRLTSLLELIASAAFIINSLELDASRGRFLVASN